MHDNLEKYKDLIDLPHHVSSERKHMSLYDRAAQFAPFAALTGFEEDVEETERITDDRIEITEDALAELDDRMSYFYEHINEHPEVVLTVFEKDMKKAGGRYTEIRGCLKRFDEAERCLYFTDGSRIKLDLIVNIKGADE